MDSKRKVSHLRSKDVDTLQVELEQVLRAPLGQIDVATVCGVFAIAASGDEALPASLRRDAEAFRDQKLREIQDLPDSPVLARWAEELAAVDAAHVPHAVREAAMGLLSERRNGEAVAALRAAASAWETVAPEPYAVPTRAQSLPPAPRKKVAAPAKSPETRRRSPKLVDERRVEWIKEDTLSRLHKYVPDGLKEPVLVAGCRHRAPWDDVTEDEVKAVLRQLDRDGVVKKSAGRWKMRQ